MKKVSETFIPEEYLDEPEKVLLQKTRKQLNDKHSSSEELRYYEEVLDVLMKNAYDRKTKQDEKIECYILTIKSRDTLFIDTIQELNMILKELEEDGVQDEEIKILEARKTVRDGTINREIGK